MMATTLDYRNFVLDQLRLVDGITCKAMMGEYLLYKDGILFGGIYDNRLLLKITPTNAQFKMPQAIPYKNAKPMYAFAEIDDEKLLKKVVLATCDGLKCKK